MAKKLSQGPKRKRHPAGEEPVKRRKSDGEDSDDPNAKILLMEQGISESKKNYNNIQILLQIAEDDDEQSGEPAFVLAAVALCRVFVRLLAQGAFAFAKNSSEKDQVVLSWLKERLSHYEVILLRMLGKEELAVTALTMSMKLLKAKGEFLHDKETYMFPVTFFEHIVEDILLAENEEVRRAFIEFAEQFDDVRFYTFKVVKNIVERSVDEQKTAGLFDRVFALISALDGVPVSAEDLTDFYIPKPSKKNHHLCSVAQHKRRGQDAWLTLMGLIDTKDQRKRLLNIISTHVAPWFNKPELLADFLTSSYDAGGSMSLLALSGVFYLIQERNLDYPSFYPKLYSLLDRDILHSKHRSRFFRLLDTFLASTHLPAALVASFVKRLSRLALTAPPSAIAFVIPWIYNVMKRHPTCTFMLHRVIQDVDVQQQIKDKGFTDPFLTEETEPMATRAIESCLWELVQLQSHYHPNVATIAKIISEQFTKQSYNMEDFLDHSYASLLEAELGKDVRKAPVIEFQIPKRIFLPQDDPAGAPDSLLVRLWDFGGAA